MSPTQAYNQHAYPSPFGARRLVVLFAALFVTLGCGTGHGYSGEHEYLHITHYVLHLRSLLQFMLSKVMFISFFCSSHNLVAFSLCADDHHHHQRMRRNWDLVLKSITRNSMPLEWPSPVSLHEGHVSRLA
jgi:hypothetical protein